MLTEKMTVYISFTGIHLMIVNMLASLPRSPGVILSFLTVYLHELSAWFVACFDENQVNVF